MVRRTHETPSTSAEAAIDLTGSDSHDDDNLEMEDVDMDAVEMDDVDIVPNAYADLYENIHNDGNSGDGDASLLEHDRRAMQAESQNHLSGTIEVTLGNSREKNGTPRAVTSTPRDRKNRVLVHQIHALAILAAARIRNRWCNDVSLRMGLQDMVPDLLLRKLQAIQPRLEPQRRERVRMFEAFLSELVHWWHGRFHVHSRIAAASAWRQPSAETWQPRRVTPGTWVDGWCVESAAERAKRHRAEARNKQRPASEVALFPTGPGTSTPTYMRLLPAAEACASPSELLIAAHARVGSRETKAILFCALCRSLGIPSRLVVSVQVCSISSASSQARARSMSTSAPSMSTGTCNETEDVQEHKDDDTHLYIEPLDEKTPPTVWVEVYSKPYQHWLTVDPVRGFFKPTGLRHMEPLPSQQRQNKLVYVTAFEEDGYARDVTARYTRTLHTRVARMRPTGRYADWWPHVVQALHRPQRLDRDAMEDVELQDAARREPMPTSVGAFKDHPVFVLERHLHRDQVVHPPHRAGTFQGQPVFLRAHVVQLRSIRQWYNVGREVKPNEIALKWVKQRSYTTTGKRLEEQVRAASGDDITEGLYAEWQTQIFTPPPVVDGHVPRNAFGNVDLFVPSMLPAGGVHIPHPGAARAAKQLGVSYAGAVVGFEFRRFRSLPKMAGIVVPAESAQVVQDAIRQIEMQDAENEREKAQRRAWKNWGKLLTALLVARRVQDDYGSMMSVSPTQCPPNGRIAPQHDNDQANEDVGVRQLREMPSPPSADQPTTQQLDEFQLGTKNDSLLPHARSDTDRMDAARRTGRIISLDEMIAAEAQLRQRHRSPSHERPSDESHTEAEPPRQRRKIVLVRHATPAREPMHSPARTPASPVSPASSPARHGRRRSARQAARERRSYAEDPADVQSDVE